MVAENPTWRAPRIHGELLMLGFEVSERSVSRWMRRAPRSPDSSGLWLSFLHNHREAIAAWFAAIQDEAAGPEEVIKSYGSWDMSWAFSMIILSVLF